MTEPLQPFGYRESRYERPNQKYVCGRLAEGHPCELGPDGKGRCPAARYARCEPRKEGDRWVCTRLAAFGGPCEQGPLPDGRCCEPAPQHAECQPRLSVRAKRGRWVIATTSLAFALLLIFIAGPGREQFISPGPLSAAHAGIAPAEGAATNCTACHKAADGDAPGWVVTAMTQHRALDDNAKCLACHFEGEAAAAEAHFVHSVNPLTLKDWTARAESKGTCKPPTAALALADFAGSPETPNGTMACAACHHEHRGRMHDLKHMSDTSCQVCHTQQFESFTHGHPEFRNEQTRPGIAFDHLSHANNHFESRGKTFDCAQCHQTDPSRAGRLMTIGVFKTMCAECHEERIEPILKPRVVVELPNMEIENVEWWDEAATNKDEEAPMNVMLWLLLAGDDAALPALREMWGFVGIDAAPGFDIENAGNREALAQALGRLIKQMAEGDEQALARRLATALGLAADHRAVRDVVAKLREGRFAASTFVDEWLFDLEVELSQGGPATGPWDGFDPRISYKPTGHADAFITAWLDAAGAAVQFDAVEKAADDGDASNAESEDDGDADSNAGDANAEEKPDLTDDAVFRDVLRRAAYETIKQNFLSTCVECHQPSRSDAGAVAFNWQPPPRPFNHAKFHHGAHLSRVDLEDVTVTAGKTGQAAAVTRCAACHVWESDANKSDTTTHGFLGHTKQSCATCHTPQRQNTSCVTCHNYHATRP